MNIKIHGKKYPVIVEKKKNKNTYIRVNENLEIYVTTSRFATTRVIMKLLTENEEALYQMIQKKEEEKIREKQFYYLGKPYEIIVIPTVEQVEISESTFVIPNEHALELFLKKQMKTIFTARYDALYEAFLEPISKPELRFRKMKTRWGVCNRRNHTITLNSKLIEYDIKYLDYVIIHELSHLVHFDHSREFWDVVSKYCPEYKQLRKEMKG